MYLLGLKQLDEESLKKAYRQKTKEYHPDKHHNEKEKYTILMQRVNEAHDLLQDWLSHTNTSAGTTYQSNHGSSAQQQKEETEKKPREKHYAQIMTPSILKQFIQSDHEYYILEAFLARESQLFRYRIFAFITVGQLDEIYTMDGLTLHNGANSINISEKTMWESDLMLFLPLVFKYENQVGQKDQFFVLVKNHQYEVQLKWSQFRYYRGVMVVMIEESTYQLYFTEEQIVRGECSIRVRLGGHASLLLRVDMTK